MVSGLQLRCRSNQSVYRFFTSARSASQPITGMVVRNVAIVLSRSNHLCSGMARRQPVAGTGNAANPGSADRRSKHRDWAASRDNASLRPIAADKVIRQLVHAAEHFACSHILATAEH
jgi:hypothetical protein